MRNVPGGVETLGAFRSWDAVSDTTSVLTYAPQYLTRVLKKDYYMNICRLKAYIFDLKVHNRFN